MRKLLCTAAAAALLTWFAPSLGHASFTICNQTDEALFIAFVVPSDVCEAGLQQNLSWAPPNTCVTPYSASAESKTFYFEAWSDQSSLQWDGDAEFWIPYAPIDGVDWNDNNWCMPLVSCTPTDGNSCGDGSMRLMRTVTTPVADTTINVVQ